MQLVLRTIAVISFIVAIIWMIVAPGFEPLLAFLAGISTLLVSFAVDKAETHGESLDQRNRRVMLNHVENFWVKGVLEKSLHGAALLELGIKEEPSAVSYPWTIKKESTGEELPAGRSMLENFQEIGLGRSLLILGAPGSGKTTMLLELARQLIECARQDETDPIPVVFNLASWRENLTLAEWLAEQLNIVYYVPKKVAPSWIEGNKLLLLLDGLDEVKEDRRARCVEVINQFRKQYGLTSLIVCSRAQEYTTIKAKLSLEGAITLQPLTSEQVNGHFDRFGNTLANVRLLLTKDQILGELAETPLMLSIMTIAYKDTKPEELVASSGPEDHLNHLFNAYIDRMFNRSTRSENAVFTKEQTLRYLSWVADRLITANIITYQIESMEPYWLYSDRFLRDSPNSKLNPESYDVYRWYVGLSVGLLGGLSVALTVGFLLLGLSFGTNASLLGGSLSGLSIGIFFGLKSARSTDITMVDQLKWSWKEAWNGFIVGPIVGTSMGLLGWLLGRLFGGLNVGVDVGIAAGLIVGLMIGLFIGLNAGLNSLQVEEVTYPGQRLKLTLANSLFSVLIFGLLFGLYFGLFVGMTPGPNVRLFGWLLVGLFGGLSFGLLSGRIGFLPIVQHFLLRKVLATYHFLPAQLIPFLEYCVSLIFLRRVGGSYIFVHRLLMEHFAEMDV